MFEFSIDGNNFSGEIPSGLFEIASVTNISLGKFESLQLDVFVMSNIHEDTLQK